VIDQHQLRRHRGRSHLTWIRCLLPHSPGANQFPVDVASISSRRGRARGAP
jgi:hypothetical protein